MDKDREVDDIFDVTDDSESSDSSNAGVFESHQPFVLELHDIRKDDPMLAGNVQPVAKKKQKKKKKGQPVRERSSSSASSDSISDASSVAPSASEGKEEFYDAHDSYHTMSESHGPVVTAAKLQAHSETSQNPKSLSHSMAASDQSTTSSRREPSTVTKPSLQSE